MLSPTLGNYWQSKESVYSTAGSGDHYVERRGQEITTGFGKNSVVKGVEDAVTNIGQFRQSKESVTLPLALK